MVNWNRWRYGLAGLGVGIIATLSQHFPSVLWIYVAAGFYILFELGWFIYRKRKRKK